MLTGHPATICAVWAGYKALESQPPLRVLTSKRQRVPLTMVTIVEIKSPLHRKERFLVLILELRL